jgi:acylphosphatase
MPLQRFEFKFRIFLFKNRWIISMDKQLCMRCYVSGKVQGVWYRASAKEQADELNIMGLARNLPDGRVEIIACGAEPELESFYIWLKQGPRLANVDECSREMVPWELYSGFEIL